MVLKNKGNLLGLKIVALFSFQEKRPMKMAWQLLTPFTLLLLGAGPVELPLGNVLRGWKGGECGRLRLEIREGCGGPVADGRLVVLQGLARLLAACWPRLFLISVITFCWLRSCSTYRCWSAAEYFLEACLRSWPFMLSILFSSAIRAAVGVMLGATWWPETCRLGLCLSCLGGKSTSTVRGRDLSASRILLSSPWWREVRSALKFPSSSDG